jgi:hypothetical protein
MFWDTAGNVQCRGCIIGRGASGTLQPRPAPGLTQNPGWEPYSIQWRSAPGGQFLLIRYFVI